MGAEFEIRISFLKKKKKSLDLLWFIPRSIAVFFYTFVFFFP